MSDIVRHEVFGNPESPAIEYLTGYGSSLRQMRPHIRALTIMGFSVHGFEYDKTILSGGDPALLAGAIDFIEETVETDVSEHDVAGIYGISLGGFIGFNILKRTGIERAMFNTGGVSILNTIWDNPRLAEEKASYEREGYTREAISAAWQEIDKPGELQAGKKVVLMISDGDKTLAPAESRSNYAQWVEAGTDAELIASKRLGHGPVIARNTLRLIRTARFFKA